MPGKKLPPKPRKPTEQRTIWMSCRAKQGCPGQQATIVMQNKTPGGGTATRYRCQTCGGAFHINT